MSWLENYIKCIPKKYVYGMRYKVRRGFLRRSRYGESARDVEQVHSGDLFTYYIFTFGEKLKDFQLISNGVNTGEPSVETFVNEEDHIIYKITWEIL